MTNILIIFWTAVYCQVYGVELPFALGTFHTESGTARQEFRVGLLAGRWYGPANIAKEFKAQYLKQGIDITTLEGNCRVGVASLRLRGLTKRQRLRKYNPEATPAYIGAIMGAERRYRKLLTPPALP